MAKEKPTTQDLEDAGLVEKPKPKAEAKSFTGNRGVEAEVTMSFMCSEHTRERVRRAAKQKDIAISEFLRDAVDHELKEVFGQ